MIKAKPSASSGSSVMRVSAEFYRLKREVKNMAEKICSIECPPECGFTVKSHDEQEVIDMAKKHAKEKHNMDITTDKLKSMMKKT